MRRVLAINSGRADASPMLPAIVAIDRAGCEVSTVATGGLEGRDLRECVSLVAGGLGDKDILLLLGDRYETLAAALAATVAGVPIAHIHGGEASFGSFDNQIRDAVTKLAHIHFVAAEPFKRRLMDLGEDEHRIHVVGAPGLDNIDLDGLGVPGKRNEPYFVLTYHPATLAEGAGGIHAILRALDAFPAYSVIWTGCNNDPGGRGIEGAVAAARKLKPGALGLGLPYLKACRHAAAVIGNSSSGIIECPSLEVPTVNIGGRQDGRLKGPSVLDCEAETHAIVAAIHDAVDYDGPFDNPYGGPGASAKIAKVLADIDLKGIMVKRW